MFLEYLLDNDTLMYAITGCNKRQTLWWRIETLHAKGPPNILHLEYQWLKTAF